MATYRPARWRHIAVGQDSSRRVNTRQVVIGGQVVGTEIHEDAGWRTMRETDRFIAPPTIVQVDNEWVR